MAKTEPEQTTGAETTDPEAERVASLDERFGKIEAEQQEHRGMLEKILDRLPGKAPDGASDAGSSPGGPAGAGTAEDMQGEVRRQIAEAKQREADEARARGELRQTIADTVEELRPEQAPREPQTGFKGRMQRAMFGADR